VNKPIVRLVPVTAGYQPMSAKSLVGSFEISALPSNTALIYVLGDDGVDVPWLPGEFHSFVGINLHDLIVKGTPGDALTVIGGTG
jgi:hypothetical protein